MIPYLSSRAATTNFNICVLSAKYFLNYQIEPTQFPSIQCDDLNGVFQPTKSLKPQNIQVIIMKREKNSKYLHIHMELEQKL